MAETFAAPVAIVLDVYNFVQSSTFQAAVAAGKAAAASPEAMKVWTDLEAEVASLTGKFKTHRLGVASAEITLPPALVAILAQLFSDVAPTLIADIQAWLAQLDSTGKMPITRLFSAHAQLGAFMAALPAAPATPPQAPPA